MFQDTHLEFNNKVTLEKGIQALEDLGHKDLDRTKEEIGCTKSQIDEIMEEMSESKDGTTMDTHGYRKGFASTHGTQIVISQEGESQENILPRTGLRWKLHKTHLSENGFQLTSIHLIQNGKDMMLGCWSLIPEHRPTFHEERGEFWKATPSKDHSRP
ncbi:hypothetical protein B9Z55_028013 [Caenorhabditis nigoni]|uniref:Uncharacterized protein n=1 Tax=Caenorhabditis nigoni TaxID=1611254 RepID=A0A2G5SDK5_9PELO|nr:hypothetical protein B9Z55_028013 [Caenorhabditis nigoni]